MVSLHPSIPLFDAILICIIVCYKINYRENLLQLKEMFCFSHSHEVSLYSIYFHFCMLCLLRDIFVQRDLPLATNSQDVCIIIWVIYCNKIRVVDTSCTSWWLNHSLIRQVAGLLFRSSVACMKQFLIAYVDLGFCYYGVYSKPLKRNTAITIQMRLQCVFFNIFMRLTSFYTIRIAVLLHV